jgi:hypothetical protein
LAKPESGKVVAFGNLDNCRLRCTFSGEKLSQLLPEKASVRPNDAVFAAVISRRAMEDVDTDLLFRRGLGSLLKGAFTDIEEEFTKPQRAAEVTAGNDSLNQA